MTLTSALRTATGSLAGSSQQVALLSKNIAGIGNPDYVRREAVISTGLGGNMNVEVKRYVNQAMVRSSLTSNSSAEYQSVLSGGIQQLSVLLDAEGFSSSPAALLGDLDEALQLASAAPADVATLTAVIHTARNTANTINGAYQQAQDMRADADAGIAASVSNINTILSQLHSTNNEIVAGSRAGMDVMDAMDHRDTLIRELSLEIGISTSPRADNDMVVTTESGLILFERVPRTVNFVSQPVYGPGTTGQAVFIDGVDASSANSPLPITTGKIAGYIQLRDDVLVKQQTQLDEFSRGLVDLFAETDQSVGGTKPALAGLFTWAGGPGIPAAATLTTGIARSLTLNSLVDPAQGGSLELIRDGGINGDADYIVNTEGSSGFSDHLIDLAARFDQASNFDAQTGLSTAVSLRTFAGSSLDWLQTQRQTTAASYEYEATLRDRYAEAMQNEMGPNLDSEMSKLLEVERAYQATAKVMSAVDELFQTLLSVVR